MILRENKVLKLIVYYSAAWLQGVCLILLPAASFIFKSQTFNGITDQQYGISFLPMNAAAILVTLNFQRILRSLGKEKIFYLGLFFHSIFAVFVIALSLAMGMTGLSFIMLLAANLALGVGFGLLMSVLNIFVVELYAGRRDTFVTGLHSALGLGAALSPLMIAYFSEQGFWSYSALLALVVVTLVALLAYVTRAAHEDATVAGKLMPALSTRPLPWMGRLFILTAVFYGISEAIIGNWTAVYLTQDKYFSVQTASLALSFFWTFMTVGRIGATFLTLTVDARILYRFSPFLILAGLLFITQIHAESRILAAYLVVGLGCSYFFPLTISLSTEYFDEWREVLPPLIVAGLMLGVFLGTFLVGFLRDHGLMDLNQAFLIASSSIVVVGILAFSLTVRKFKNLSRKTI